MAIAILLTLTLNATDSKENNISNDNYTPMKLPYLNVGTKELETKYPWLYEKMEEILLNQENSEAYALEGAYFKRLDDLNGDGIDEIYLHSQARCGASICNYRVYQLDTENKKLREIMDAYSDDNSTKIGKKLSTGWKRISVMQCFGAENCSDMTFVYDLEKEQYLLTDKLKCNENNISSAG